MRPPKKAPTSAQTIVEHVSNSSLDHPLIHLPKVFGIDMSVTKHVLMLWVVAAVVLLIVTIAVRRYLRQDRLVPSGFMNALEFLVEYIRDEVVATNVGKKWVNTWTPLHADVLPVHPRRQPDRPRADLRSPGAAQSFRCCTATSTAFLAQVIHGGSTVTGNFNVTAGLAVITFFAIIIAGTKAHGFIKHWKNLVPPGVNPVVTWVLLIPIEIIGMFVRPFALTMRLAANMTGGHIAILAILSFVFIFAEQFSPAAGMGVGVFSLATAVADLGARSHRRVRSGVRLHPAHGRVHWHGHSRSSLSFRRDTKVPPNVTEETRMDGNAIAYMGAGLGVGLIVIGAGLGIGRLASGAAEAIGRQPSAAAQVTGAVNLPLFLLEGVAIIGEVVALLIVLAK